MLNASAPLQNPVNIAPQSHATNTTGTSNLEIGVSNPDEYLSQSLSPEAPQAEPSSGAHRRQGSITANLHREADNLLKQRPEKRKRSRVTPEQLIELEREFSTNRTPTGAERKAISDRLGMNERQTQIWFQNRCVPVFVVLNRLQPCSQNLPHRLTLSYRRAKAKHQEARPLTPERGDRDRSMGPSGIQLESYIAQLIREKERKWLIACAGVCLLMRLQSRDLDSMLRLEDWALDTYQSFSDASRGPGLYLPESPMYFLVHSLLWSLL